MKKHLTNLFLLLMIISLNACNIPKNVTTSQPELPAAFRSQQQDDKALSADISRKTSFNDIVLQSLIDRATSRNYYMLQADENIQEAHQRLRQSELGCIPDAPLYIAACIPPHSDKSPEGLNSSRSPGAKPLESLTSYDAFVIKSGPPAEETVNMQISPATYGPAPQNHDYHHRGNQGISALCWAIAGILFAPLGIIAFVKGIHALKRRERNKGIAIIAVVLGSLEILFTIAVMIVVILFAIVIA